jgi:hypothetical protein
MTHHAATGSGEHQEERADAQPSGLTAYHLD